MSKHIAFIWFTVFCFTNIPAGHSVEVCSQLSSGKWACTYKKDDGSLGDRLCDTCDKDRSCVDVQRGKKTLLGGGSIGNAGTASSASSQQKGSLSGSNQASTTSPYLVEKYNENTGPGDGFLAPGSFGPNGPVLAGAIFGTVGVIAHALDGLNLPQEERERRYSNFEIPTGMSSEHKSRAYELFQDLLNKKQAELNQKRGTDFKNAPEYVDLKNKLKRFQDNVANIEIKSQPIDESSTHDGFESGSQHQDVVEIPFNTENLSDEETNFLVESTLISKSLRTGGLLENQASERWTQRSKRAFAYWTKEAFRKSVSKLRLSNRAQEQFNLPSIAPDSLENYEVIRAANLIAREPKVTSDAMRRFHATLFLNQAQLFASEGELYATALMLENALGLLDFSIGIASGVEQNLVDMVSGMWHLVSHPIDSAEAIAGAIVNYEKTWDAIVSKAQEVLDNYDSYSLEEKGVLIGYLATEVATTVFTGGGKMAAEVAKAAKLAKATEIALEGAIKVLKNPALNRFEAGLSRMTAIGQRNVEHLRGWAREQGYMHKIDPVSSVETWGEHINGQFEWRVKIKSNPGVMEGLHADSMVPRASVRTAEGKYFNPYTGENVNKISGSHIPLEFEWLVGGVN